MSKLNSDPYADAAERDQVVVIPNARQLFVDIDTEEDYAFFKAQIKLFRSLDIYLEAEYEGYSGSGAPHRHIYLKADHDLSPIERVALQACLGSDRKRELLSLGRIYLCTDWPPTLFFESSDHPMVEGNEEKEVVF
jgi:hypothetical protein